MAKKILMKADRKVATYSVRLDSKIQKNGFCFFTRDHFLDHDATKDPKNPCPEWIFWFL